MRVVQPALAPLLSASDVLLELAVALDDHVAPDTEQADDLGRVREAVLLLQHRVLELGPATPRSAAARIRHDLRTPLNHVIGYGEMLQDDLAGGTSATGRQLVAQLLDEARSILPRLGAAIDDLVADDRAATPVPPPARAFPPAAAPPGERGRLLVADDNAANLELLRRLLEPAGHEVVCVADGAAALEAVGSRPFDLVLLDVLMPRLDGFEVLQAIKSDPQLRHLPVLMITSLDELDAAARAIGLGAADYLTKPFEPVLLHARIRSCLEAKRLRDQQVEAMARVREERHRARELLRVILPDPIVEELERTNEVKPRRYEHVAVLFCDIVGFTSWCDRRRPEEVVPLLQRLVEAMEVVTEDHGMQKIKTIGDGFMAVAGLLVPDGDPVRNAVACGEALLGLPASIGLDWQLRVGIHVGPVVAGVLGRRQFQFDLWGDTVNTAARVESYGVNGGLTLSRAAWDALQAHAPRPDGRTLGRVDLKGKGAVELVEFLGFGA